MKEEQNIKMSCRTLNVLTGAALFIALVPLANALEETTSKRGEALTGGADGSEI
jgi:hypothetical protein